MPCCRRLIRAKWSSLSTARQRVSAGSGPLAHKTVHSCSRRPKLNGGELSMQCEKLPAIEYHTHFVKH